MAARATHTDFQVNLQCALAGDLRTRMGL
jgi:hypothetical protein